MINILHLDKLVGSQNKVKIVNFFYNLIIFVISCSIYVNKN